MRSCIMARNIHFLLYFSTTYTMASAITLTRTSNACYSSGGDCAFHSLSCEHGFTISLRTMQYGFKQQTVYDDEGCETVLTDCAELVSRTSCCEYDVRKDCLKTYSVEHQTQVKERCNGKTACSYHATYVSGGCRNPPADFKLTSTYSVITYVCENVTTPSTSPQGFVCDGCASSPPERTREPSETEAENRRDEGTLQLIVGVSVGVGSGVISLVIIAAVCYIRVRRKPPATITTVGGTPPDTTGRRVSRTTSNTHTTTSSMPSSLYSSFLYSDTLPSSHPDSLYSLPQDDVSPANGMSYCRNYDYDDAEEATASPGQTDVIGTAPDLPERPRRLMTSRSPQSNDRPMETNGIFSLFSLQLGEKRPEQEVLSSSPRALNGSSVKDDANLPGYQSVKRHDRDRSNHTTSRRSDYESVGGVGVNLPLNNQPVRNPSTSPNVRGNYTTNINNPVASPNGELRSPPTFDEQDFLQNGSLLEPVYAVPDKARTRRVQSADRADLHQQTDASNVAWSGNIPSRATHPPGLEPPMEMGGRDGPRAGPPSSFPQADSGRNTQSRRGYRRREYDDVDVVL